MNAASSNARSITSKTAAPTSGTRGRDCGGAGTRGANAANAAGEFHLGDLGPVPDPCGGVTAVVVATAGGSAGASSITSSSAAPSAAAAAAAAAADIHNGGGGGGGGGGGNGGGNGGGGGGVGCTTCKQRGLEHLQRWYAGFIDGGGKSRAMRRELHGRLKKALRAGDVEIVQWLITVLPSDEAAEQARGASMPRRLLPCLRKALELGDNDVVAWLISVGVSPIFEEAAHRGDVGLVRMPGPARTRCAMWCSASRV